MYIINYDFPNQIEDYVHRIGRTGRAGSTGTAYSLFTKKNFMLAPDLANIIKRAEQNIPEELQKFVTLALSTKSEHVYRRWNVHHDTSKDSKVEQSKDLTNNKLDEKVEERKEELIDQKETKANNTDISNQVLIDPLLKEVNKLKFYFKYTYLIL